MSHIWRGKNKESGHGERSRRGKPGQEQMCQDSERWLCPSRYRLEQHSRILLAFVWSSKKFKRMNFGFRVQVLNAPIICHISLIIFACWPSLKMRVRLCNSANSAQQLSRSVLEPGILRTPGSWRWSSEPEIQSSSQANDCSFSLLGMQISCRFSWIHYFDTHFALAVVCAFQLLSSATKSAPIWLSNSPAVLKTLSNSFRKIPTRFWRSALLGPSKPTAGKGNFWTHVCSFMRL